MVKNYIILFFGARHGDSISKVKAIFVHSSEFFVPSVDQTIHLMES